MKPLEMIAIAGLSTLLGCGGGQPGDEAAETQSETEQELAEQVAALISPDVVASRIGGTRMIAGNFVVELLPHSGGQLKALLSKPDGETVPAAKVAVVVQGKDGSSHEVTLDWDASVDAYVGAVAQGIAPGTVVVEIEVDGVEASGRVESLAVAPAPLYGGHVIVVGDLGVELRADADGTIMAVASRMDQVLTAGTDVELEVGLEASNGQTYDVPLAWDTEASVFLGALPEGVSIVPGALSLRAEIDGVTREAALPNIGAQVPEYDGDVVAVEDMTVELVGGADGELRAYPKLADGSLATDGQLTVNVGEHSTNLEWDADARAYRGVVPASVDVSATPLTIDLRVNGRRRTGGLAATAGRALGVSWRARLDAGAGGAIPPGQFRRLVASADVRSRVNVRARPARPSVSAMGRAASAMVNARGRMAEGNIRMVAGNARMVGAELQGRVRGRAASGMRQADAVRGVMVRPPSVMARGGASAGAMSNGDRGMGGGSAMVSLMVGF